MVQQRVLFCSCATKTGGRSGPDTMSIGVGDEHSGNMRIQSEPKKRCSCWLSYREQALVAIEYRRACLPCVVCGRCEKSEEACSPDFRRTTKRGRLWLWDCSVRSARIFRRPLSRCELSFTHSSFLFASCIHHSSWPHTSAECIPSVAINLHHVR